MITLKSAISSANFFSSLAPLVRLACEDISFLGWRYFSVAGYEGRLPLEALAIRVTDLAYEVIRLSSEERVLGRELALLMTRIYQDEKKAAINVLTSILCDIREFLDRYITHGGLGIKDTWEMDNQHPSFIFGWYTREQCIEQFGFEPSHDRAPQSLARVFTLQPGVFTLLFGCFYHRILVYKVSWSVLFRDPKSSFESLERGIRPPRGVA